MNILLLSGGSGKRLWPLSNTVRAKQFIPVFRTPDGSYESMVQRVYRQLRAAAPEAPITVSTFRSQISSLRHQLGEDVFIIAEPCRRDTFPAIALAAAYLHDVNGVSPEESVVVCPVDPYAGDDFFAMLPRMAKRAAESEAGLVLMGMQPDSPSEKYGYILPAGRGECSPVAAFREKPDAAEAERLIAQGALWNGGVFAFRLGTVLERTRELLGFCDYRTIFQRYESLKAISFDYAVVEHESFAEVLRFPGKWEDIGTWNALTEIMDGNTLGKALLDESCENTCVINELDIPVLCLGIKNTVVAVSPQGVLVSDRERSAAVKPYVDALEEQIMFAEKSWGSYRVLDAGENSLTVKLELKSGASLSVHSHAHRSETWTVLSGRGTALVDGRTIELCAGDTLSLPQGSLHSLHAHTRLWVVETQLGSVIVRSDKQKYPAPPEWEELIK